MFRRSSRSTDVSLGLSLPLYTHSPLPCSSFTNESEFLRTKVPDDPENVESSLTTLDISSPTSRVFYNEQSNISVSGCVHRRFESAGKWLQYLLDRLNLTTRAAYITLLPPIVFGHTA